MERRIDWTGHAENELRNNEKHLIERWPDFVLENFRDNLRSVSRTIARHPFSGNKTSNPKIRSFPVKPFFRLFYRVFDGYLEVESFFDMRQDPAKNPYPKI